MMKIYECDICGAVALDYNHVCGTRQVEDTGASCGKHSKLDDMSSEMKEHLAYICGGCGRLKK
jgi:hypothetical protein